MYQNTQFLEVVWIDPHTGEQYTSYYEYTPDRTQVVVGEQLLTPKQALHYTEIFGGEIVSYRDTYSMPTRRG